MLRVATRQRAALSETLREFANLAVAALVLGQVIGTRPLSWRLMGVGALVWLLCLALALALEREE